MKNQNQINENSSEKPTRRGRKAKFPFDELVAGGESVFISFSYISNKPGIDKYRKRTNLAAAATQYGKRNGAVFSTKMVKGGVQLSRES